MSTQTDIIYKDDPTWEEFFAHIPIFDRTYTRIVNRLKKVGFQRPIQLFDLTQEKLVEIDGISENKSKMIYECNMLYKRQGKICRDIDDLIGMEAIIGTVSSGSDNLDNAMPGGGFETHNIYEIVSLSGFGKTQLCLTIACNVMRMKKKGGLNRSVLWLDSQRDFRTDRLLQIAGDMTQDRLKKGFSYSTIDNLDELEYILGEVSKERWGEIGCLIIDSLILPIRQQYPVCNIANVAPMKEHLIRIFKLLRIITVRYNLMVIFTNTLRKNLLMKYGPPHLVDGDVEMEYGTDMRIQLDSGHNVHRGEFGLEPIIKLIRARLLNSNRIPEREGFFIIGNGGIGFPEQKELSPSEIKMKNKKINGNKLKIKP